VGDSTTAEAGRTTEQAEITSEEEAAALAQVEAGVKTLGRKYGRPTPAATAAPAPERFARLAEESDGMRWAIQWEAPDGSPITSPRREDILAALEGLETPEDCYIEWMEYLKEPGRVQEIGVQADLFMVWEGLALAAEIMRRLVVAGVVAAALAPDADKPALPIAPFWREAAARGSVRWVLAEAGTGDGGRTL